MAKNWLYRLFGVGKVPGQLKAQLESEGILLQDEGISETVTYTNFHSPGRYSNWRRVWATGALVVTQTRLVALHYASTAINVPFSDPRVRDLDISLENDDRLRIGFDASLFHSDWKGKIEYRFRTSQAQAFLDTIKTHIK